MKQAKAKTLPQLNGDIWLTEGGIETYIMYKKGFEIPNFSLFHLLNDKTAAAAIKAYLKSFVTVAEKYNVGLIHCGPLYRASRDWGKLLGYSPRALADVNHRCIDMFRELADESAIPAEKNLFSGVLGPRGDAYKLNKTITAAEAEDYHAEQIATLKDAGADLISGITLNKVDEAIGIARAAKAVEMPVVISFTLNKQAKLESGQSLKQAIAQVDEATRAAPAYYMINCTHPIDFADAFESGEPGDWTGRLGGIRANASSLDKGTLCQLGHLEEGDPVELGQQMGEYAKDYPHISVWGGCCGTDAVHVEEICKNVLAARQAQADPLLMGSAA